MAGSFETISTVGDGKSDSDEVLVASASTITFFINESGNDTATKRFLGLGRDASKLVLRTDEIITVNQINSNLFKVPMTIPNDESFTITRGLQVDKIVVQVYTANTALKLFVA